MYAQINLQVGDDKLGSKSFTFKLAYITTSDKIDHK